MSELSLYPHQVKGVAFLKSRAKHALLWDEQRVGKTPQAIVASGELGIKRILIITTVAGVGVWKHQWKQWDRWNRKPAILPWSLMSKGGLGFSPSGSAQLLILDEGHYAKSFDAQRTRAIYGWPYKGALKQDTALLPHVERVWHLTGTPMPHDPGDIYPVICALFPELLLEDRFMGLPDVSTFEKFRARYCVMANKRIGNRVIKVVIRGQNLDELNMRIRPVFLRRRQKDVGIRPAFWDTLPIEIDQDERDKLHKAIDLDHLRRQIDNRGLDGIEPMLAPVRRITGVFKAKAMVKMASDFLDGSVRQDDGKDRSEKLVIAYWHRDVGDLLERRLEQYGVVRVDGSVTGDERTIAVARFTSRPANRVFLAQIKACGEAIDLSAASEMWFAESTFTPADMAQMGARITNLRQPHQCLVRVASLSDTIDELIQDRLIGLSRSIAHTLGEDYHEDFAAH